MRIGIVDVGVVYRLLRRVAMARPEDIIPYGELSRLYQERTEGRVDPHRGWIGPLDAMNKHLSERGYPPLSALVVVAGTMEPGGGFWECCDQAPARPATEEGRLEALQAVRRRVYDADWPASLP